jgi:hypothetical protein
LAHLVLHPFNVSLFERSWPISGRHPSAFHPSNCHCLLYVLHFFQSSSPILGTISAAALLSIGHTVCRQLVLPLSSMSGTSAVCAPSGFILRLPLANSVQPLFPACAASLLHAHRSAGSVAQIVVNQLCTAPFPTCGPSLLHAHCSVWAALPLCCIQLLRLSLACLQSVWQHPSLSLSSTCRIRSSTSYDPRNRSCLVHFGSPSTSLLCSLSFVTNNLLWQPIIHCSCFASS